MKINIKDRNNDEKAEEVDRGGYQVDMVDFGEGFSYFFRNHMVFFILLILFNLSNVMLLFGGGDTNAIGSGVIDSDETVEIVETVNDDVDSAIELAGAFDDGDDIPEEYTDALERAKIYAYEMYLSKSGVYRQLTSSDGDKFSDEAAGYAVKHLDIDWKENAVVKGKQYFDDSDMDLDGVYNHLASEDADRFLIEEAEYAIENLNEE